MRRDLATVYASGVVQGVALVTFPAASAVFTSPLGYGLSSTRYGAMFLPQAAMAVLASLAGAGLTRRLGVRRLLLAGLAADLVAMLLLVASRFATRDRPATYGLLLVATGFLGTGFGLAVPAMNDAAAALAPRTVDRSILLLNALLGVGTALAPVLLATFVDLGAWWCLPVLVGCGLAGLLVAARSLDVGDAGSVPDGRGAPPAAFWGFAAFALLYGVIETLAGNWATLYMSTEVAATAAVASLALTVFWASVTGGRILFAALGRWLSPRVVFRTLPFLAALAFLALGLGPVESPAAGVLAFGVAGLACSALLPLAIGLGRAALPSMTASVAGALVASYQIGYGVAAFGVGPAQQRLGLPLRLVLGSGAVVSVALAGIAFVVVSRKGEQVP